MEMSTGPVENSSRRSTSKRQTLVSSFVPTVMSREAAYTGKKIIGTKRRGCRQSVLEVVSFVYSFHHVTFVRVFDSLLSSSGQAPSTQYFVEHYNIVDCF